MNIDIKTFSQRLSNQVTDRVLDRATKRTVENVRNIAKAWLEETRFLLSTPASNRGFTKNRLNLHNKASYNDSLPMMISGRLRNALRFSIRTYSTKKGRTISIRRWFTPVYSASGKSGQDYSEILDKEHPLLQGFKERLYAMMDTKLRENL
jgi:hypothetical protein